MSRLFILSLALLSLVACERKEYPVTGAEGSAIADYMPELDDLALSFMDDQGLTGMGVAIYTDGKIYRTGYGYEDYQNDIAVHPDMTLFRWASLSKSLTGVIAARMVERGIVSLDDKANELVPGYRDPTKYFDGDHLAQPLGFTYEATLRDLLMHRSGLRHFDNGARSSIIPPDWKMDSPDYNTGMEWAFDLWAGQPLAALPGVYSYSNPGFHLAGAMLERASGRPYEQLAIEYVAAPLRMQTLRSDKYWVDIPHRALGYERRRHEDHLSSKSIVRHDASWMAAGGGMMSSIHDMAKFCSTFLNDELMSDELKYNVLFNTGEGLTGYGLGVGVGVQNGYYVLQHYGNWDGTRCVYVAIPTLNLCFAAAVSTRDAEIENFATDLLDRITQASN